MKRIEGDRSRRSIISLIGCSLSNYCIGFFGSTIPINPQPSTRNSIASQRILSFRWSVIDSISINFSSSSRLENQFLGITSSAKGDLAMRNPREMADDSLSLARGIRYFKCIAIRKPDLECSASRLGSAKEICLPKGAWPPDIQKHYAERRGCNGYKARH
jgi:hypothetical protein